MKLLSTMSVSGHMRYPGSRIVGRIVWFITAIAAINWGAEALGYNLFNFGIFQTTLAGAVTPLKYVIGASGVISLLMFFADWGCNEC